MKRLKLLFAVVAIFALSMSSCKKEENNNGERLTHFYASSENDNTDITNSKSHLSGLSMHWDAGDSVRLWGSDNSQGYLYKTTEDGDSRSEFVYARTGNAPILNGPYAIGFPARYWNTKNVVTLPATQKYVANSAKDIPQYAFVNSSKMTSSVVGFYNVCGLLKLNLTAPNMNVTSISVTTNSPIYGDFNVSTSSGSSNHGYSSSIPTLTYSGNGGNTVTLVINTPQSIDNQKSFYIYIPAGNYSQFEIAVTTDNGRTQTRTANSSILVERGKITTIALTLDGYYIEHPFSVSANTQVLFSSGNLQCINGHWRFAPHQYDFLGTYSSNSWDLFGWSTEATDFGMSTSTTNDDYSGSFWDWGTAINPGAASTPWRTLTDGEWTYLLSGRTNATNLWGMATITIDASTTVQGLVLLPDNWTTISTIPFAARGSVNANRLSLSQWNQMETNGAVFLPAAGNRNGTTLASTGANGNYWTATSASNTNAYYMGFASATPSANRSGGRHTGRAVRLVQDAN